MELNREMVRRIRGIIVFAALVVACMWKYDVVFSVLSFVLGVLFPFILGGAIAFVLSVPMKFIEKHLFPEERREKSRAMQKMARPVSLFLVIFCVFGVVVLVMFVLIPQLADTAAQLGRNIQNFIIETEKWIGELFHNNKMITEWIDSIRFDWNSIIKIGMDFFKTGAGNMLGSTLGVAKRIVSGVATFFIAFVFSCYILLQKEKLRVQVKKVMYAFFSKGKVEAALEVLDLTYQTFSGFLTGQCLEALILGTMFAVTLTLFRMPYALLIGMIIAFTALIPVFGAFIGCVVGTFLIFVVNPVQALIFLILFLVLQQIEGNLIYPHVVGNSVGLPSIWVLVAVSLGGSLMGVVGMVIFIPLVSVLYALFREVVYLLLKKRKIKPEEIL